MKKLQLLAAEFFAGNTTVRNELVHVLDALLKLKQVTRKEYTNIIARLVVWHFAVRRCQYRGSGIVSTIGSLLARYATKAMVATAAKAALKGPLKAAKRAILHLIAHKVASTIADAAKKQKRVDINVKCSREPQSKKAFVDTGPV